ncbi:hypothetical protein ACHAXT_007620 [Thalassiosira profunda]
MVPHDFEHNAVHISVWRNVQKQRKPNPDPSLRRDIYWDLRGRHQTEYDLRLDALPDEGVADTVAGEIFRAATKIYYDCFNNAMVNNTSGALNYLARLSVLSPSKHSAIDATLAGIFETIHPYCIGARIHYGEMDVLYAVEALLDRTLDFLREHPHLDNTDNSLDYHTLRDQDERPCMERCAIRNRLARDIDAEQARWAKEVEGRQQKQQKSGGSGKKKKSGGSGKKKGGVKGAKKKAQDHRLGSPGTKGGSPSGVWSGPSGEKENNGKKQKRRVRGKKSGHGKAKQQGGGTDLSAKFCKLGLGGN